MGMAAGTGSMTSHLSVVVSNCWDVSGSRIRTITSSRPPVGLRPSRTWVGGEERLSGSRQSLEVQGRTRKKQGHFQNTSPIRWGRVLGVFSAGQGGRSDTLRGGDLEGDFEQHEQVARP